MKNKITFTIFAIMWLSFSGNSYSQLTDIDGNVYKTVTIGNQVWTAENLNTSHYRNGDTIIQIDDPVRWENNVGGAWCYYTMGDFNFYNNPYETVLPYGKLYNWYAVNDERGLAPEGWHVATLDDWKTLLDNLGGYEVAGGKMKTYARWQSPADIDVNSSGFTMLFGGYRSNRGLFLDYDKYAYFWTSTEYKDSYCWCYDLYAESTLVARYTHLKGNGLSVRLVKD